MRVALTVVKPPALFSERQECLDAVKRTVGSPNGHQTSQRTDDEIQGKPTAWWLIPRIASGLVHPTYNWDK